MTMYFGPIHRGYVWMVHTDQDLVIGVKCSNSGPIYKG